jgi:acyl-CoA thioesterase
MEIRMSLRSVPPRGGHVATAFGADQSSKGLGIELIEVGEGRAVVRMRVARTMINGQEIAHGGYVFILADTAFSCASNSHGPVTVAEGADITFLMPVREGEILTATAAERVTCGRTGIYDVTVSRGDGEVVAEFRGRSRTLG